MTDRPYLHPGLSPEELSAVSQEMNKLRWRGTNARERSAFARQIAIHPGKERCTCGVMTLKRAQDKADKNGKGLGHEAHCTFYRRQRHRGKRKA
jgi:hypothetical protein